MKRRKIDFSSYASISADDAQWLLDEFRKSHAKSYEAWMEIERDLAAHPGDSLKEASQDLRRFLLANFDGINSIDISRTFVRLREEIRKVL